MDEKISLLEGYDELCQSIIDKLHKCEADEPKWMFENDQNIDLSDLVKDRSYNKKSSNGHDLLNGFEKTEKILLGRVLDIENDYDENYLGYDQNRDLDEDWLKDHLKDLINKEMSSDIEVFAERHDIEAGDVEDALLEDEKFEFNEVFDYPLNHTKYAYSGSVPVQIDLCISIDLVPSLETACALCTLKISPQSWIEAVNKAVKFDCGIADQFSSDRDEIFDPKEFKKNLSAHVSVLSSRGFVFEADANKALVDPAALLGRMTNDWNTSLTELMLCFNLGSNHVENVSTAVSRTLEDHEIEKMPILLLDSVELMPRGDYDQGKGEGLMLSHPFACKLGDIKLSSSDHDDRAEPTVHVAGAMGLLMRSYEILLKSKDSEKAIEFAKFGPSEIVFEMPLDTKNKLRELYVGVDGFDAEKIGAKYPGLAQFIDPIALIALTKPKVMGQNLLGLLSRTMDESAYNWGASENRERAAWLVNQGADLDLRLNDVNKAGKVVKGKTGPQAIHLAASIGDIDLVRSMHSRGADVLKSYRPQMAVDGDDTGVWESCIRRAVSYRINDRTKDVSELAHVATWLESLGGGQASMKMSGGQKITSSTMISQQNCLMGVDEAVSIVDDVLLSVNYLARLKQEDASFGGEKLTRSLLMGMNGNSINFSRACLDAGARTDTLINGSTVEAIARKNTANTYNGKDNRAIDDAVAYGNALTAREAIEDLMRLTSTISATKPRFGTSSAASGP